MFSWNRPAFGTPLSEEPAFDAPERITVKAMIRERVRPRILISIHSSPARVRRVVGWSSRRSRFRDICVRRGKWFLGTGICFVPVRHDETKAAWQLVLVED